MCTTNKTANIKNPITVLLANRSNKRIRKEDDTIKIKSINSVKLFLIKKSRFNMFEAAVACSSTPGNTPSSGLGLIS